MIKKKHDGPWKNVIPSGWRYSIPSISGAKNDVPKHTMFRNGGFLLTACVVEFGGVLIYTFPMGIQGMWGR